MSDPLDGLGQRHVPALDLAKYHDTLCAIFNRLRTLMDPTDAGGILVIHYNQIQYHSQAGRVRSVNSGRIAREKIRRLWINHHRYGHVSAWQSRKPNRHQYAGAFVLAKNLAVSFSGLSEHWDEVILLLAAGLNRLITRDQLEALAALSQNPCLPNAMEIVNQEFGLI